MKISMEVSSLGDLLNLTPLIRKVGLDVCGKTGERLKVYVKNPHILKNNPYCELYDLNLLEEDNNPSEDFIKLSVSSKNNIVFRNSMQISNLMYGGNHLVDYLSLQMGFMLAPNEKKLDYFPDNSHIFDQFKIPTDYVVLNPSITWDSRTWKKDNWQELINSLNKSGIFTVLVGKGEENITPKEATSKLSVGCYGDLNIDYGLDLQNKTNLDDLWHLMDKSSYVVCMDSGLLHFAGTTDTHIVMIPGSINPYHRLPFRSGSQNTNSTIVYGDCQIYCASNIGYMKSMTGDLKGCPPISSCLEGYDEFKCHSFVDSVFNVIDMNGSSNITPENEFNFTKENQLEYDDSLVTYHFENEGIDINSPRVNTTKKIFLTFWESLGKSISIKFKDTSGNIKDSDFVVDLDDPLILWFEVEEQFIKYNDFKVEIRNSSNTLVYEKILK